MAAATQPDNGPYGDDGNESYEFEAAAAAGDLSRIHHLYCAWLVRQSPDPPTGYIDHTFFDLAAKEAAANGKWDCLNYFLSRGQQLCESIFEGFIISKSINIMEGLLTYGWSINRPRAYDIPPLFADVVVKHDMDTIRWFLEHGADPNAPAGEWDITPLSYAVQLAPLSVVQLLFEHGGSASKGQLVWHAAHRNDDIESIPILQYLVDKGAPTNFYRFENRQWLHCWAQTFHENTPLYVAARAGHADMVTFLLAHGADPTKRGCPLTKRLGYLPMDGAVMGKHDKIIEILNDAIKSRDDLHKNPTN